MGAVSSSKARILDAGTQLFRRQGYEGTGLKQIVEEGRAPWGSLYHFFPGGKEQLGIEVVYRYGENYKSLIEGMFAQTRDPLEAVRRLFDLSASELSVSDFEDGCPIVAIALDAMSASISLRRACADVVDGWTDAIAQGLESYALEDSCALQLGTAIIAALEGGIALSRIVRSTSPLVSARDSSVAAVCVALDNLRSFQDPAGTQPRFLGGHTTLAEGGS